MLTVFIQCYANGDCARLDCATNKGRKNAGNNLIRGDAPGPKSLACKKHRYVPESDHRFHRCNYKCPSCNELLPADADSPVLDMSRHPSDSCKRAILMLDR